MLSTIFIEIYNIVSAFLHSMLCLHSAQAEGVSDNVKITKEALESSQAAIKKAEDAMTTALENLTLPRTSPPWYVHICVCA